MSTTWQGTIGSENHRGGVAFLVSWPKQPPQKKQRKDLCYQLVWRRELSKKKVGSKMFWKRWGGWDDDGLRIGGVRKSPAANVLHVWYTKKCLKMDRWILLWRSCPIWKRWRSLPSSEAIKLGQGKAGKPRGESSHPAVKAKRGKQWKVGSKTPETLNFQIMIDSDRSPDAKKHVPSPAVRMFSCKSPDVQLWKWTKWRTTNSQKTS